MENSFHTDLQKYIKDEKNEDATHLILNELAKALVKDREDFIEVLRSADLSVFDGATDIQLIDGFVKNAPTNKKLLLGASFLVNHRNQTVNFDGESEINDTGVKNSYKAMDEYFNAGGAWADAIKGIVDVGGKITGKVQESQDQKKRGASINLDKQQEARKQLAQQVLAQRQQQLAEEQKSKAKTTKILIISGVVVLVGLIGLGLYIGFKKNKS